MDKYLYEFSNHLFAIVNHCFHSSRNDKSYLGFNLKFNQKAIYNKASFNSIYHKFKDQLKARSNNYKDKI